MNPLQHAFENLTQPQADVLTAATTLVSALIVAIFAPLMFHLLTKKGFRDFNAASETLRKASERVDTQAETVGKAMDRVRGGVDEFRDMLGSLQQSLANTQNTLIDSQANKSGSIESTGSADKNRERIREIWRSIQELVERAAARDTINGNTRAKYTRWDRRNYLGLINTIHSDGNLPGSLSLWEEAYTAWQYNIRSVPPVSAEAVQRMEVLYGILSAPFAGGEPPKAPNAGAIPARYTKPSMERFNGGANDRTLPSAKDKGASDAPPTLA